MRDIRGKFILGACVLMAVTWTAYLPVTQCGYVWDDDYFVLENEALRSPEELWKLWFEIGTVSQYYPVVFSSLWIEYHVWQLDPVGYHVVNVVLHSLGAVLLWRVLSRLDVPGAWAAAALFALHPVYVESVAWIAERKNVLSGVFYFGSALAYLRWLEPAHSAARGRRSLPKRSSWIYSLSFALFVLALLSKSVTSSLPAALLLVTWWKHGRIRWADVRPLVPFFVAGIGLGLLTIWMEKHHVHATGEEWRLSFIQRCLIAGRAVWFYASKLFWPAELTFIYPRWNVDALIWWQYLFPITALAVLLGLWCARHRAGWGPVVAVLYFTGTLFPALGFVNVYPMRYSFVADHFQYLASVGLLALAAAGGVRLANHWGTSGKRAATVVLGMILFVLGCLTFRQIPVYQNLETLWRDTLSKNPSAWMAHNNLALILHSQNRNDEAIEHFRETIRLNPRFVNAYYNWGNSYYDIGQYQHAVEQYSQAIRLQANYLKAHFNQANAYQRLGRHREAIDSVSKAIELDPRLAEAYYIRGNSYFQLSELDQAIEDYNQAIQLDPRLSSAWNNRATVYARQGRLKLAWRDIEQVRRLGGAPNQQLVVAVLKALSKQP